jgi:two-component system response regulator FixJ
MTHEPTVFIVDDDDAVRDSLMVLLDTEGFKVEAFESPIAFLESSAPSRPGVLLVDIRMPGMDGLELQEQLNARGHNLPAIFITGHADVPLAVRAMKAGALDFVEKPFDEDLIVEAIRRAVEQVARMRQQDSANAGIAERLKLLTPREREVLDGLVAGHPNKVIAYELSISPRTVEIHRSRVMEKMQAHSLSHLVRMALEAGISPKSSP